jgi:hypothetical protein
MVLALTGPAPPAAPKAMPKTRPKVIVCSTCMVNVGMKLPFRKKKF